LPYSDFLDSFKVENRTHHLYYSFAEPPGKMNEDYELPPLMQSLFDIEKVTFWQGFGTITRPHTDAMENMMCMFKGWKKFHIASPNDRKFIYTGTEGYPDNYSPCEFYAPDYKRYPLLKKARLNVAHIEAGDCLYVPAYWWHQVESCPTEAIGIAAFFKTYHQSVDLL